MRYLGVVGKRVRTSFLSLHVPVSHISLVPFTPLPKASIPNMELLCPRTASFDRKPIVGIASTHLFIIPFWFPQLYQPEPRCLPGLAGVCEYRADEPTI